MSPDEYHFKILEMYTGFLFVLIAISVYVLRDQHNMRMHRQSDLARLVDSIKAKLRKP